MAQERAGVDRLPARRRPSRIHHVGPSHTGRQREPACQRFAQADEVRHRAGVLAGKPSPRATETRVNLVQNQQGLVLVAKPSQHGQEARRRNIDAAAHLDRLDQDRANSLATEQAPDLGLDRLQCCGLMRRLGPSRFACLTMGNGTKCPNSRSCSGKAIGNAPAV